MMTRLAVAAFAVLLSSTTAFVFQSQCVSIHTIHLTPFMPRKRAQERHHDWHLNFASTNHHQDSVPAPAEKMTASASIPRVLSRTDGQELMNTVILPANDYGNRIETGRDAQGLQAGSGVAVTPQDARMFLTYGEFPLDSLDELLDLALPYIPKEEKEQQPPMISMIDVGSGCGRLALYAALTRGSPQQSWNVHGIEISPMLHQEAVQALTRAMQQGHVQEYPHNHHHPATMTFVAAATCFFMPVLHTSGNKCLQLLISCLPIVPLGKLMVFHEDMGAMVIGNEWSGLLSESCPNGCVVVTTDRALDPAYGWQLVDRLNVDNREVMGSTGYIHVLKK